MAILTNMSVPTTSGNNLLLMPKLQNRFRVSFLFDNEQVITGNVVSVSRPTLSFEEVQMHAYNSRVYIAGKHEWSTVSIVIRDDVNSQAVRSLDRQLNRQIDMASQSTPTAASSFKFITQIDTLDGTNGTEPGVLDQWTLVGTFIQNIEYGNNDYSDSTPIQVSVTLRYDSAIHSIPGDNDTLSGQFVQTSEINATGGGVGQ
jgi:hypothetical protein